MSDSKARVLRQLVQRQRTKLAKLDESIGRAMSIRAEEEQTLADMLRLLNEAETREAQT